MRDLHHLHLVELVLADQAAGVTAVGAGFGAEARRVGGELQRQLIVLQHRVAYHIGHGDFRGGNQVLRLGRRFAATLDTEHVLGEFRQLAGAVQHVAVDDVRGVGLAVAVLVGMGV